MRVRRQLFRQRVLIPLASGRQVSGIVLRSDRELVELADVQVLTAGRWQDVDGRMYVPMAHVEWMQAVPHRAGLG